MTGFSPLPAIIASRYVPVRLLAQGGMSAVYEVEHARTGEHWALKLIGSGAGASAETLERFKREARASARVGSEHVVRVVDADVAPELGGAPFLVMELLDGIDLARRLAHGQRPDAATVVGWLMQAAITVDRAHRAGIIHRDLKPENLFLTSRDDGSPLVKVLDFGIIKIIEEGTATTTGKVVGTPRYMAPEQATSGARVTPATDRYALGLVAYHLLTGESYYQGDVMLILAQLLHEPLRPPSQRHPELGAAFDAWFARACHRDPELRFPSAVEQVRALAAALALGDPAGVAEPEPSAATPRRAAAALIATTVVLGGALGVVALSGRSEHAAPAVPPAATARAVAPPPRLVAPAATTPERAEPVAEPATEPPAEPSSERTSSERSGPEAIAPRPSRRRPLEARRALSSPAPAVPAAAKETPAIDPYADQK